LLLKVQTAINNLSKCYQSRSNSGSNTTIT